MVAVVGCYDPRFKSCITHCGPSGECPTGLVCKGDYCAATGTICPNSADGSSIPDHPATDGPTDTVRTGRLSNADQAADVVAEAGRDVAPDLRRDATSELPDALRDHQANDGKIGSGDGSVDAAADQASTDARTDAASDRPVVAPECPPRSYLNVTLQTCIPAHDLNGDGRADLLAVNSADTDALISNGTSFTKMRWLDGPFYGIVGGTFGADVTGSGFAAGVAFADGFVGVIHTAGPGFGSVADNFGTWFLNSFWGNRATFLADLNGDGAVDMLAVNEQQLDVALSETFNFQMGRDWMDGDFTGYDSFFLADVDGDGAADLIGIRAASVDVFSSTGKAFNAAQPLRKARFAGTVATFFADVDGDGRADGVRIERNGAWVARSTGHALADDISWFDGAMIGQVASFVADADGDGRADFIAIDDPGVWVSLSTGTAFSAPTLWYPGSFAGTINTTVAPVPSTSCGTGP